MKAAVLQGIGKPMAIIEAEMPKISENELMIRVAACGVCHTDLKLIKGLISANYPTVPGHEISGTIEAVGTACKMGFEVGDNVIVGLRYKCGNCDYCRVGRENLCMYRPNPSDIIAKDGSLVHRWILGGFAEYLSVPEYTISRLPQGLPLKESAVLGCRVTTAYNAVVNGANFKPGSAALVIGCGGLGLNIIKILSLFGAFPVIAVDLVASKLDLARKFGATHTINASKEKSVIESIRAICELGVDTGFEAIGLPSTSDQVIQSVKPGGTAVLAGSMSGPMQISDSSFAFKEVKVTGIASRRSMDVRQVLLLASQGKINPKELVTNSYYLTKINEAYKDLEDEHIQNMGIIEM